MSNEEKVSDVDEAVIMFVDELFQKAADGGLDLKDIHLCVFAALDNMCIGSREVLRSKELSDERKVVLLKALF